MSGFYVLTAQALCPAPSGLESVAVERIVDGDTLRLVDGRSVRLIGLNSPELGRKGRTAEPYAEQAKRRLNALVEASNGRVLIQPGEQPKDRYARTLAHIYSLQGDNLEAQLLAEGLGYWVAISPNLEQLDCLRAAEQAARRSALGIWRKPSVIASEQIQMGGFALIQGQVERVDRNRGGIWVELQGSLVLHVPVTQVAVYKWADMQALVGRVVEVRGWLVDRSRRGSAQKNHARWMLGLGHPSMLRVLPAQ